jgi:hypothetical protein
MHLESIRGVASHFKMTASLANEKTVVSIDPDRSNGRLRQAKAAEHSRPAPADCPHPASSQESARAGQDGRSDGAKLHRSEGSQRQSRLHLSAGRHSH